MRAALAVALLLACAPAAQAAQGYQVKPGTKTLYVRNKASGYVIGTAFAGQRVDVQLRDHKHRWGYGAIYGQLGSWSGARCGWFQLSGVVPLQPTQSAPDFCPGRPHGIPEGEIFLRGSYYAHVGTGAVYPAQVKLCADSGAYGNYDPSAGTFFSRYGDEPTGRGPTAPGFGIRYLTKDGKAAMVKDSSNPAGAPRWFFMHADCLAGLPVYIGEYRYGGRSWPLANRLVQPGVLEPYNGGRVASLHWRLWGAPKAESAGRAEDNTCEPACSYAHYVKGRAHGIVLSRRRLGTCDGAPALYYTRLTVPWPRLGHFPARTDRFRLRRSCHPYLSPLNDDGECGRGSRCGRNGPIVAGAGRTEIRPALGATRRARRHPLR